jgi:predicted helicase
MTQPWDVSFEELRPDARNNWLDLTDNDFETFIPLASKETKAAKTAAKERAIFKLYSLGVSTNRDEWLYGNDRESLKSRVGYFVNEYEAQNPEQSFSCSIKWSRNLKRRFSQNQHEPFQANRIKRSAYRPYSSTFLYDSNLFVDECGLKSVFFPSDKENKAICFSNIGARTHYVVLAVDSVSDLHFGSSIDTYQQVPIYYFDDENNRFDNITDWSLKQFRAHYKPEIGAGKKARKVEKEDIFHYCYAVLHDPIYREKYALNLKRDFPRIPFYPDFRRWADWGRALLDLHLGYEQADPFPLTRTDTPDERARAAGLSPKVILRADPESGAIRLDSETSLTGIPPDAWTYRLGNRSALDWILDQHKEKTPKDPTIRERFNTYRFADHKERVIDLLRRVATVSVETMRIVEAMRNLPRTSPEPDRSSDTDDASTITPA